MPENQRRFNPNNVRPATNGASSVGGRVVAAQSAVENNVKRSIEDADKGKKETEIFTPDGTFSYDGAENTVSVTHVTYPERRQQSTSLVGFIKQLFRR